ncbi:MAG TPA: phage holin family protein [Chitinophagaceae bacterium]|nr:phage holin family protein [Chitinophagaceae bacterium]HMU59482.1 phage holin family protein [Chitinophagaceae bacterium]
MSEEFKKAGSVFEQVTAYVNTRVSQAKLSVAEKLSQGIALLVAVLLSALVFFLSFCLLSAAAAILIGQWLGSLWLGFAIMAFFVLLAGVLIWKLRGRLFQIPLLNKLLTVFFEKDRNEKDEKD